MSSLFNKAKFTGQQDALPKVRVITAGFTHWDDRDGLWWQVRWTTDGQDEGLFQSRSRAEVAVFMVDLFKVGE